MNLRGTALTLIATLLLEGAVLAAPYTVQSGDTLYSLAKRFMTTPAALQAANKLGNTVLRVGQIVEIPERMHTVQKGETLYGVARFYEVTVAQVRNLNALSADAVEIGQKLLIPWNFGAASNTGSSPAPTPASSPVQMPVSRPVPPSALPSVAPIVIASPELQLAPDMNALPPLPSAAQMPTAPERPQPSLPSGPLDARTIQPPSMPVRAALPSISDAADPTVASRPDAPTLIHTVQSGDTLFSIAKRYSLSVEQIRLENSLKADSIALGQRLRIPVRGANPLEPTAQFSELREIADRYLGVTYVYGGSSASGLDCSGFVSIVYRELGVTLPRTSREQFLTGIAVKQSDLESGDLVFFDTLGRGAVSHVGIYLGSGEFIHAASNPGKVITSRLEEKYYATRYLGARRVWAQD